MKNIKFRKRRLGNSYTRAFGIMIGIYGLFHLLFSNLNNYGYAYYTLLTCGIIIFGFGTEMIAIDFRKKIVKRYFNVFFTPTRCRIIPLPKDFYLLIFDFGTVDSFAPYTGGGYFYEISFMSAVHHEKLVLLETTSKRRVKKIIDLIASEKNLRIVDRTSDKTFYYEFPDRIETD